VYLGVRAFFSRNRSVFSLGLVALVISSLGDLLAGATLGFMTGTLELLPGLMILIPPAIGMRGNIFGALGSRLGTAMHIGIFEVSFRPRSILRQNMEASLLLTLVMSLLMGVLAYIVAGMFGIGGTSVGSFVFISVLGGSRGRTGPHYRQHRRGNDRLPPQLGRRQFLGSPS